MNDTFFFDSALLPDGWRNQVRIESRAGSIASVQCDARPGASDVRGAVAVPGMPNLHSHAFQRAMAGLVERLGPRDADDFWSWRDLMYRFVTTMDADDIQAIATYAYADMLEAGFTSVAEFHYVHRAPDGALYDNPAELALRHVAAADTTGIGLTMLPVFYEASDFGGAPPTPGQRRFITDVETFASIVESVDAATRAQIGRHTGFAAHSLRATTPGNLDALLRQLPTGPVHIHIAEQTREVEACKAWSGQRPVEWLFDHAEVDARWCLVHATHVTDAELDSLVRSRAVAGLCPVTEANLGDGIFPARAFVRADGIWGVGSDSNVRIDAAGELRQLEYSQRLALRTRNALASPTQPSTGRSLHEAALKGGAQALGQPVGAIAEGHRADFVVLDGEHPDLTGRSGDTVIDTWLFASDRSLIDKVIAGGQTVVENHRHHHREDIDAAYRDVLTRLLKSGSP